MLLSYTKHTASNYKAKKHHEDSKHLIQPYIEPLRDPASEPPCHQCNQEPPETGSQKDSQQQPDTCAERFCPFNLEHGEYHHKGQDGSRIGDGDHKGGEKAGRETDRFCTSLLCGIYIRRAVCRLFLSLNADCDYQKAACHADDMLVLYQKIGYHGDSKNSHTGVE